MQGEKIDEEKNQVKKNLEAMKGQNQVKQIQNLEHAFNKLHEIQQNLQKKAKMTQRRLIQQKKRNQALYKQLTQTHYKNIQSAKQIYTRINIIKHYSSQLKNRDLTLQFLSKSQSTNTSIQQMCKNLKQNIYIYKLPSINLKIPDRNLPSSIEKVYENIEKNYKLEIQQNQSRYGKLRLLARLKQINMEEKYLGDAKKSKPYRKQ